jgi:amidase
MFTSDFPVFVDGAHFVIGATQVDGEVTGDAAEISARVTVSFRVLKRKTFGWPRVVSDEFIMTCGSARSLEDAACIV